VDLMMLVDKMADEKFPYLGTKAKLIEKVLIALEVDPNSYKMATVSVVVSILFFVSLFADWSHNLSVYIYLQVELCKMPL
jgi:hypothetical protein